MADEKKQTREERLAAQLRENLKRRKAQARILAAGSASGAQPPAEALHPALPQADDAPPVRALPKSEGQR